MKTGYLNILLSYHAYGPVRSRGDLGDLQFELTVPGPPCVGGNARKLIDKLSADGRLRPAFLLRALQAGETELFDLAFAALLELDLEAFRRLYYEEDAYSAALACRAVGIDRSVFPAMYEHLARATTADQAFERRSIESAFRLPKPEARTRLRACI